MKPQRGDSISWVLLHLLLLVYVTDSHDGLEVYHSLACSAILIHLGCCSKVS